MTRWVAIFEDDPAAAHVRREQRDPHFAYLSAHAARIRLGGGLRAAPTDDVWVGGLWIIDADTREEAVRLCEEDPFFVHGLRKSYRLLAWGRAPGYGEVGSVGL